MYLTPKESFDRCQNEDALILDIREDYLSGFKALDVPKTLFIPFSKLKEHVDKVPKEILVIVMDSTGLRSKSTVDWLKEQGYETVVNLAGGIVEWERDGLPIVTDKDYRLSGGCVCQLKYRERKHNTNESK